MGLISHRDRVLRALNHQQPDRIPLDFGTIASGITVEAYERLKKHLGIMSETEFIVRRNRLAKIDEQILKFFDIDTRILTATPAGLEDTQGIPQSYKDSWGVLWAKTQEGHYYASGPPFAGGPDMASLRTHDWPEPPSARQMGELQQRARELYHNTDYAIVMALPGRVNSLGERMCGFENWYINLIANPRFAGCLLDKGVEVQLQMIDRLLSAAGRYVDVVYCADDLGTQNSPLISPGLYRRMIKPRQKTLYEHIKSHTDAKLVLHTDGAVSPLIGDFIDIGVDAMNPVQVSAAGMETKRLKKEFGSKMMFWGAIDTQHVLPYGDTAEVYQEVKKRIDDLGVGGGYVLAPVHNIQPEVPPQNIRAMFQAALEYGKYNW